jgi:RHS repeat-associated protein
VELAAADLDYISLNGISCDSATDCWAVGNYMVGSEGYRSLLEHYDGSGWTQAYGPNPLENILSGVDCISRNDCWAVGNWIEHYNGTDWTVVAQPPSDGTLLSVTCVDATDCWAVGYYFVNGYSRSFLTLIEQYNGSTWTEVSSPNTSGGPLDVLHAVTCLSASQCWAVGENGDSLGFGLLGGDANDHTLIESYNGSAWSIVASPNPTTQDSIGNMGNQLFGVSCVGIDQCWAVGYQANGTETLVLEYTGTAWSVVPSPSPATGDYFPDNKLYGVSCVAGGDCWAVGFCQYSNQCSPTDPNQAPLVLQYSGGSWTVDSSAAVGTNDSLLYGVACSAVSACFGVGTWGLSPGGTLTEQDNGGTWDIVNTPTVFGQQQLAGGPVKVNEVLGLLNCACKAADRAQDYTNDPVDSAYGNLAETSTDLSVPGLGIPLDVARTYNSATASVDGPLGFGWTSNLFMSLSQPGGTGPVTITQEGGAQVVFNPSGSGYVSAVPRDIATLIQNANGTWTFTRQAQDTYTFSSTGQLIGETDLNGYTTTLSYNASGQLTTVTDPAGRTLGIGWTGSNITSVTDPNVSPARVVSYDYDSAGDLTDVIDVNGGDTHYAYNSSHQITNIYDPKCYAAGSACNGGHGVVNSYDSSGRITSQQDQLGRTTTWSYSGDPSSASGGTTAITDPEGNVTQDIYQDGLLTQQTKAYGTAAAATWQYVYDPTTAALVEETDPNGNMTSYSVDGNGNRVSMTDPLGRYTQWTYNSLNEVLTKTDPSGVTTTHSYDTHGNLLSVSTPLIGTGATATTTYTYGNSSRPGEVTATTDPDGNTSKYGYDAYGDQVSVTNPLPETLTTCYNADGWKVASYTPKAGSISCGTASSYETTYSYVKANGQVDGFGDVQKATAPLGEVTSYTYDADRNVTSTTDPDGNTTTYVYDLANERTDVKQANGTDQHTDYTLAGQVLDQKDGNGNAVLTYGYDAQGQVTSQTDALGHVKSFTYDGDGNELTEQVPGGNCPWTGCTTMTYDVDSELTQVTYSDGVTPNVTAIAYDSDGRRISMTDGTGTSTWSWDSLQRLTGYTDGAGAAVSYGYMLPGGGYELNDWVREITYPGNLTVTRSYDKGGELTAVQDWLGKTYTFGYDADGNLTSRTLPSGTSEVDSSVFNAADQLTSITDTKGSSTLLSAAYSRNGDGGLTSDSSVPTGVGSYQYTAVNQLCYAGSANSAACSSAPSGSQAYSFDAAGNLTGDNGTAQSFNVDDQLCWTVSGSSSNGCSTAPTGATTYAYDAEGDLTTMTPSSGSATTLGYDQANRLTSSGQGSTTTATYAYDGDGLRMSQTVSGVTIPYTWDVSGSEPLLLSDGSYDYVYGPGDVPLEQVTPQPAITLVGTASASGKATSLTLILPSGTTAGEQVVVASTQPSTTTVTAPSGYTQVTTVTSTGSSPKATTTVFRHTVASGDTSVKLTYSSSSTAQAAVLAVYKGVDPNLPIDVSATGSTAAGTTVTAPSVTPTYAEDQLVVFQGATGSFSGQSWTAPSGTTEEVQGSSTANVSAGLADQSLTLGATGTRASTFGTSANLTSVSVALSQPHTISLVGTATASGKATSLTITLPSGVKAGDQVVVASTQPSTTTLTAPSGYTQVATVTSGGSAPKATTTVFRHTVVSGDTSVKLTYSTSSTAQSVVVAVYRGADPNLPIDVSATGSSAASTTVTGPSVTPIYANDRLLVIQGATGSFSGKSWTAPSSTTEEAQSKSTANTSTGLADQFLGAAGATGTRVSTFGSSANLTSVVIAVAQPPSVLYLHQDQLGSTRMLTDGAGVVRATFTYDPYGNLTASTGHSTTAFLYAGQYRDAVTGFYYLRARYYDPATAQFLTVDPDVATTLSPYGYVSGNPLNGTDPSGLDNCGWFSRLCDGIATGAQAVETGFNAVAPVVSTVAHLAADACAGASLFGVADEFTLPCATIASGIATLADADLAIHGEVGWDQVVLDVVGTGLAGASWWAGAAEDSAAQTFGLTLRAGDDASVARAQLMWLRGLQENLGPLSFLAMVVDSSSILATCGGYS